MDRPDTNYVRSGGAYIAYQTFGDGPVVILLVPGGISNVDLYWDEPERADFYRSLAAMARVVVFDKRGVGASDRVAGVPTLEQQAEDVRAVMDAVALDSASLHGAWDGAAVAAMFTASYPQRVRALSLWEPRVRGAWAPDYPWGRREPETPWTGSRFNTREHVDAAIRSQWPSRVRDAAFRDWYARTMRLSTSPSAFEVAYRTWFDIDVRHVLGSVHAPTLVMHGALGDVAESRYVAERIAGATFAELPLNESSIWYGDAERALALMRDFHVSAWDDAESSSGADRVLATVLFTDLVGSTERAVALGPRWQDVLRDHNTAVRRELARFRGHEIDVAGDGFFASGFEGPARAIRCACAIRDVVEQLGLQVRVGVHTGECDLVDGKLAGVAVAIGARVAAQAQAGEVLVSGTVKDLVAGSGIEFESRGSRDLKGVGDWHLYAVAGT